jgi:hypothetical protein
MDQRLLSVEIPVEELLTGHYAFSIPSFQRDYSWSRHEALQLLDDIVCAADDLTQGDSDTPYFLGTMLFVAAQQEQLEPDDNQNSFRVDVIDGQQRLITLTILFCVLRDLAGDDELAGRLDRLICARAPSACPFQLRLRGADEAFFATAIQSRGAALKSASADAIGRSRARANIENVRRALRQRLQRECTPEDRARIAEFAMRHTRVLVVTASDFDYAYRIFLTINDRGKLLSVEDIFRAEIIGPLNTEQRQRFSLIVEEMDRYMDEDEKRRSRGKTFFSHLAEALGWSHKAIVDELRRVVAATGGPKRFAAEVFAPMAEAYLAVKSAGSGLVAGATTAEICHWLTALGWLEQHGDDDWVGVAMLALAKLNRTGPELPRFLAALDRFALGLLVLGCGRGARRNLYAPVLAALAADEVPAHPESLLRLSPTDEAFIVAAMATRTHKLDPQIARLVLLRLDAALSGRSLGYYTPLMENQISRPDRLTVEHVLPQGGVDGLEWARLFPRKVHRAAIAQCIGNLVLVSEAQNQMANQREFSAKKRVFFGSDMATTHPLLLTDSLRQVEQWDVETIGARYKLLTEALQRLWGFEGPVPAFPGVATREALASSR